MPPQNISVFKDHVSAELQKTDERMDSLLERIAAIERKQVEAEALMTKYNEVIERVDVNTAEMLGVFNSWKGAMQALEMIGKAAKPLAAIAALVTSIIAGWMAWKNGTPTV